MKRWKGFEIGGRRLAVGYVVTKVDMCLLSQRVWNND